MVRVPVYTGAMVVGTETVELRACRGCGWWAHWLSVDGRCGPCVMGWTHCLDHGRWEWTDSLDTPAEAGGHRRVAIRDVLAAPPLQVTGEETAGRVAAAVRAARADR